MTQIQLFSYPTSPYAQKVGCYLKFKQLDYRFVPVNPLNNREIAFSRQRQVPVMQIGEEWRKESSDLGLWLDERYPERPLMPSLEADRKKVLEVDAWISSSLIPSMFRHAVEWQSTFNSILNGWKLSRAVSNATRLPWFIRLMWPFGVKRAPFIVEMVKQLDLSESMDDMMLRLQNEFITHLGDGPYLGEQAQPTLADLSAFPIIVSGHLMGMRAKHFLLHDSVINEWALRVQTHLPKNPLLVPDKLLMRRLG